MKNAPSSSEPAQTMRTSRFKAFDGIRALSALLVILNHQIIALEHSPPIAALSPVGIAKTIALEVGGLPVSIFFVLSGFLITTLLIREKERTGSINIGFFFARRARRLLPAYFIFLAVVALLSFFSVIRVTALEGLFAALFIFNYYPIGSMNWWLRHTWSLGVEQQFYAFWPFLLCKLSSSGIARFAVACIAAEPVLRILLGVLFPSTRDYLQLFIFTRLDMLMFGVLAALTARSNKIRVFFEKTSSPIFLWALCFFSFFAVPLLIANIHGFGYLLGYSIVGLAASSFLFYLSGNQSGLAARILSWGPLTRIGVMSYSVYLWQQLFFSPDNHTLLGIFPFNLAATFGVAHVSYELVERRFFSARPVLIGNKSS